jgi:hypothetical protein
VTDERLALLVRAAMRGFMEAVLAVDTQEEPPAQARLPQEPVAAEEIAFPSVTAAEEGFTQDQAWNTVSNGLFGEAMPQSNADLDAAVAALARARAQQAQEAQPAVQGGPGEKEVAEWLRIPNI